LPADVELVKDVIKEAKILWFTKKEENLLYRNM
jgi:hypothetical protein